jgi:chaperonin GroES
MTESNRFAKPLGDRVLLNKPVDEDQGEEKTASGIYIPETVSHEKVVYTEVVAVGEGLFTQNGVPIPMSVKVGDTVIIPPYHQGQGVKMGGKEYIILRESEILMVVKK